MAGLDENMDQARRYSSALASVADAARAECARLQASMASHVAETARQVAGLEAELTATRDALAEASAHRDLLRFSSSWRATRPVRQAVEALPGWARSAMRRALAAGRPGVGA